MHNDNDEREKRDFTDTASDIGRWAISSASILLPLKRKDYAGALLAAGSILSAAAASKVLKDIADRWRPDGRDTNSFPSQHVAESFAAASAMNRSGFSGIAAYGLAVGVSVGRWRCREHHIGDIVAGGLIGLACTRLVGHLLD